MRFTTCTQSHSSPCLLISTLHPWNKETKQQTKIQNHLPLICRSVIHNTPPCPNSFTCNESLVWFKVSGFCYTINIRYSPGLQISCVIEFLQLWVCRTGIFCTRAGHRCCLAYERHEMPEWGETIRTPIHSEVKRRRKYRKDCGGGHWKGAMSRI